ncbi:fimbrial protein [Escherichia sp. B1147]|uniref:fimbrial protein n=1 Tax=Escherichia sp. B1147 TaxID=754307 RepID=UPI0007E49F07|nr:fimbrial protein [Escherichia sp. B1147]
MNKKFLAAALATSFVLAGSATAGTEGGQINIGGLVTTGTCAMVINNQKGYDYNVMLKTVTVADVQAVERSAINGENKQIDMKLDCSGTSVEVASATMTFDSMFNNTSQGTLSNIETAQAAKNVDIALHNIADNGTAELVKIGDSSSVFAGKTSADKKSVTWTYKASYVTNGTTDAVTAGHVKANTSYIITYQ